MWQRIKEGVKRFWRLHIVDDDPDDPYIGDGNENSGYPFNPN